MESRGNGNTVLLTVVGVATLLVALVGATFAYFSASISNKDAQQVSVMTVSPASLVYASQGAISLTAAQPSDSGNSTFTVANTTEGAVKQQYSLRFMIDLNSFRKEHVKDTTDENDKVEANTAQPNQLLLTITNSAAKSAFDATNGIVTAVENGVKFDFTDGASAAKATTSVPFVVNQTINAGTTDTYAANLQFVNLETNQNENVGKSFAGHIEIYNAKAIK